MSAPGYRVVAVDFDGTLAVTRFPQIIAPIPETIRYCKKLKRYGAVLILYTCRKGKDLQDAVDWCREQGLTFDYINENTRENIETYGGIDTRKICADVYIDDKAVNPKQEKMWKAKEEIWMSRIRELYKNRVTAAVKTAAAIVMMIEAWRTIQIKKRRKKRCRD